MTARYGGGFHGTEEKESWVYEALIDSEGQLLRLRAKDANGNEGEVPVTEGSGMIYQPADTTYQRQHSGRLHGQGRREDSGGNVQCRPYRVYGDRRRGPGGILDHRQGPRRRGEISDFRQKGRRDLDLYAQRDGERREDDSEVVLIGLEDNSEWKASHSLEYDAFSVVSALLSPCAITRMRIFL